MVWSSHSNLIVSLMIRTIYEYGVTTSMQTVPVWWAAVASIVLLAGPCIVVAYAEPVPVAAISQGTDGFTALSGGHVIAIHDISDRTYALVGGRSGPVQIVDITHPAEPLPVAVIRYGVYSFPGSYGLNGIAIHDISDRTYAMVVRNDIQIVDITSPDNPVLMAVMSHDNDGFATIHQPEAIDTHDISGRAYAVVGSREGVQIIDITRPDNPVPVAVTLDDGAAGRWSSVNDIVIRETAGKVHAFVITRSPPICGLTCTDFASLHVIDITHPADPLPISPVHGRLVGSGIAIHDISNRTYALLTGPSSSTVHIADITHLAEPLPVSTIQDDTGGFAELNWASDIAIHDISNRTYAVVASAGDDGVQIIDITHPNNPLPVAALNDDTGGFAALGGAQVIAIHDISNRTYAVVGGHEGVQIMDITLPVSEPAAPVPAACHIPAAARTAHISHGGLRGADDIAIHDISGRTYAVVTASTEMWIVDITRPADPVLAAILSEANVFTKLFRAENVAVHDISNRTYAVVGGAFDDGVQIIDITSPDYPFPVAAMFDEGSYAHTIALQIASPVAVLAGDAGGFTMLGGANDIAIHDISNRTYTVVASAGDDGVQIIDITHPDNPLPVAALSDAGRFIELDGGGSVAIAKTHGRTYAVATSSPDGNVQLIDVTDPGSPVPIPTYPITSRSGELNWVNDVDITQISGRTYAVATSSLDDSIHIINMTDPGSPVPVASVAAGTGRSGEPGGTNYVSTYSLSGRAYAVATSSLDDSIQVINMTDPGSPVLVPASVTDDLVGFGEPGGIRDIALTQISGRTYAVETRAYDDWVHIVDITDPASFVRASPIAVTFDGFVELDRASDMALIQLSGRTYAVSSDNPNDDVYIIDITDTAYPVPVASITDGPSGFSELRGASGIAIHDIADRTYAVVASAGDDGVQIMDITHPDNPLPVAAIQDDVGGFTELSWASDVAIHDISDRTYAVVASAGDDGVQIMDITHPDNPLPVVAITDDAGGFTELNGAFGIAIHDIANRTYAVVDGYEGVQIIDITHPADPLPAAWVSGGPTVAIHDVAGGAHLLVSYDSTVYIIDTAHPATAGCLYN